MILDPLVSICIPAYRQPALLERCLSSIAMQTYKRVEVLVSDDSPDDGVKIVAERFVHQLRMNYVRNDFPLGPPANWNAALRMARGEYVMVLHHDDSFALPESLSLFLRAFQNDPAVDFVFARNSSIELASKGHSYARQNFLTYYADPELLLTGNTIGAPSNLMLKASAVEWYNEKLKWVVDIEMYIRLFRKKAVFDYIDKFLVNIGIHAEQVTNECIGDFDILLYENIVVASDEKFRLRSLKLYDFYWRLLRNAGIRTIEALINLQISEDELPAFIRQIVSFQRKLPLALLRVGAVSKIFMTLAYLQFRFNRNF